MQLGDDEWPGETLIGVNHLGQSFKYSPETGQFERGSIDAVPAIAPMRALAEGPDGRLYAGSFLNGGLAAFDPETSEMKYISHDVGQAEGATSHDGALYVGTYPTAAIHRYDPMQPVVAGENPRMITRLDDRFGQSRPVAMASAGRYLAVGSVPKNGERGGGFTLIDTETWEERFVSPVKDFAVVGLVFSGGVLYGSTSVYSGVGGPRPAEWDAKLFAYDVDKDEVIWETSPISGEGTFGDLVFDKEGMLWTHSPVSLVRVDPTDGSVLRMKNYGPYPWDTVSHAYGGASLWMDPYLDHLGVVTQGAQYMIDPTSEELGRARYVKPASFGLLHNNGTAYLGRDTNFYSLGFSETRRKPTVELDPRVAQGREQTLRLSGFGPNELVEIWVRPNAQHVETLNVDENGSAEVSFEVSQDVGQARVAISRLQTNGQLFANFEVAPPPTLDATAPQAAFVGDSVSLSGVADHLAGDIVVAEALTESGWVAVGSASETSGHLEIRISGLTDTPGEHRLRLRSGRVVSEEVLFRRVARMQLEAGGAAPTDGAQLRGVVDGPAILTAQVWDSSSGWRTTWSTEIDQAFRAVVDLGAKPGKYRWRVLIDHESGLSEESETFTTRLLPGAALKPKS